MISLNKTTAHALVTGSGVTALELEASGIPDGVDVTFTSSDDTVATVDEDGNVETLAVGSAVITATTSLYGSATCNIYVHSLDYEDSATVNADSTYDWVIAYDDEIEPKAPIEIDEVTLTPETEGWSAEVGEYDEETGSITVTVTVPDTAQASDSISCNASILVGESHVSDDITLTVGE